MTIDATPTQKGEREEALELAEAVDRAWMRSVQITPPPWLEPPYCTKCTWLHWPETSCMDEKLMPIPTSIAAAIIEWDRRGRLVDDESYVQNNAPVIARVLWDAVAALKQANAEICALVPMPFEGLPDFSLACPNEADRACLTNALLAIRAAIEMAEGLHEGDWCEEAPASKYQLICAECADEAEDEREAAAERHRDR